MLTDLIVEMNPTVHSVGFFILAYLLMQESDYQSTLTRSFSKAGGFMYKIPDSSVGEIMTGQTWQRPFDAFGTFDGEPYYIESKFHQGYEAFSFSEIRDHQLWYLRSARPSFKDRGFCGISLALWRRNDFYHAYFFDIILIDALINRGKRSILKKELVKLQGLGAFIPVVDGCLDVSKIREVALNGDRQDLFSM